MASIPRDADWIRRSFLVSGKDLDPDDLNKRIFTTARLKYTDTSPGGNVCINPPAQFTRHADPKVKGVLNGSEGMGRYYSENIDDNNQIIHIRCGVPQFNSMTSFFTSFYNSNAGQLARTGRSGGVFYSVGKAIGFVVQLASWKLLTVHFLGAGINYLAQKPSSKFYYSKPAMPLYWNAVTTIVNHMAVNRGVVPRAFGAATQQLDKGYEFDDAARKQLNSILPSVFDEGGGIDMYAISTRAKRLERQRMKQLEQIMDNAGQLGITDLQDLTRRIYSTTLPIDSSSSLGLNGYLQKWFDSSQSKEKGGADQEGSTTESVSDLRGTDGKKSIADVYSFLQAELDDGAAFASFRVNATGPQSEQFSTSVGESELSSKINGIAAQARNAQFSFAEGNLIGGPVGDVLGAVTGAIKNVGRGILDSVQLSGLATLSGAAFVDIPKHYQSSMAQLTRMNYTIDLVSPYGNVVNQLINLDMPLAMLLAMALPKSCGLQSYTSPFLIELFDRGRCQTRLGMIDSMSITRGTGNIGFNVDGKALGLSVSFSVVDMSSVMHMPITENFSFIEGAAQAIGDAVGSKAVQAVGVALSGGAFDEDTVFSDYLAVLSGMALNDQIYGFRKLKLQLTRKMQNYKTWKSPAHIASFLGDTMPARFAGAFFRGTDKR